MRLNAFFMSLMLVFAQAMSTPVHAHEVTPSILDFEISDGTLNISIETNLEAFLAGINLDGLEDTDQAAQSGEYDRLRALPKDALEAELPALIEKWSAHPLVTVGETPVALFLSGFDVIAVPNLELPRPSQLKLAAPFSTDAETVRINWPSGAGDLVLRQNGVENAFTGYLSGGDSSPDLSVSGGDAKTGWGTFAEYIPVGFDHILPKGLDHILFVLGLFFFATALGPLLWQVTAFTAAHTVTLALGALGLVNVPGSIVEPLIAASIVYVAVENIFIREFKPWRFGLVFAFGLLHGLGFASVLGDFGLPEAQFVPALLGFNVGVEIGQLTVIAIAAILLWVSIRAAVAASLPAEEAAVEDYPVMFRAVSIPVSIIIALIGAWWVIERTLL